MATATPIIQTIFTVADKASPVFVKINQRMTVINRTAQQAQQRMDAVGRSMGGLGTAISVGAVVTAFKKAIDITSDYEQQVLRISGVMEGMDAVPTHQEAINTAVASYKELNRLAALLPGETEEYVTIFEKGLPGALQAGLTDIKEIADFTSRFGAVMMDANHSAQNVGESMHKLMTIHPRALQRDVVLRMMQIAHLTKKQFYSMTPVERFKAVDAGLKKMTGSIEAQANSIDALFGAAVSNAKMALVGGIKPVMEEIRHGVKAVSEFFEKNNESLSKTVALAGLLIIKLAKMAAVAKGVSMLGGVPMLQRVGGFGMAGAAKTAGAVSRGIGAAGAAARGIAGVGDAMNIFSKASIIGRVMSMFISAAPVVAGLVTAIAGFGVVITLVGLLRGLFSDIINDIDGIRNRLLSALDLLVITIGRLVPNIKPQESSIGKIIEYMIYGVSLLLETIRGIFIYAYTLIKELSFDKASQAFLQSGYEWFAAAQKAISNATPEGIFGATGEASKLKGREELTGNGKGTEINFYNARFDIKQQFAEGFDPDRIAVAFANGIAKMGEMKVYSQFTPAYSSSTG
jgi:hypothetical protein